MRVVLLLMLLISQPCMAEVIYGTREEIDATIRGRQLGEAAYTIGMARVASIQRQSKIVILRNELNSCGNCSSAAEIRARLNEAEQAELKTLHSFDGVGNRAFRDILNVIIDPMGLRDKDYYRRYAQDNAANTRRNFLNNLRNNYCYASSSGFDEQRKCLIDLSLKEFEDNEKLVINTCASAAEMECIEKTSLVSIMQKSIINSCKLDDTSKVNASILELMSLCKGREPPADKVESVFYGIRHSSGLIRSTQSYGKIILTLNDAWERLYHPKTVECTYKAGFPEQVTAVAPADAQVFQFWLTDPPPGFSEIFQSEKMSHSDGDEDNMIGVFSQGTLPVKECPASWREAKAFKKKSADHFVPTDESRISPRQANYPVGKVKSIFNRILYPNRSIDKIDREVIRCDYFPVEKTKYESYYFWKDAVPQYMPELAAAKEKVLMCDPHCPTFLEAAYVSALAAEKCPESLTEARSKAQSIGVPAAVNPMTLY